jgi:hypothetical protein
LTPGQPAIVELLISVIPFANGLDLVADSIEVLQHQRKARNRIVKVGS